MILAFVMLAAALSAGNAEFDRSATQGAYDIAIGREVQRLETEGPEQGALAAKMLADPKRYETAAQAKETAKEDYAALVKAEYEAAKGKIEERLGLKTTNSTNLTNFTKGMNGDGVFERRFAEERKTACETQAKGIAANVKPAEADFGRKDEKAIRAELEGAVIGQQRATVFEENKKYISEKIVDPIMESAKKEINRQREYLKRTRCEAYAPSVLEKELAANLEKNVAAKNAKEKDSAIVWGVFPVVVSDGAKEIAEKRTLERVAHAIDDVEMKIDAESIRGRIASDRERHRKASDSEAVFRGTFAGLLTGKALDKVIADAPSAEREEFKSFVMERAGEASLGKAVDARVKRELLPRIREIRGEIAAEDAAKIWPELMDGTWYPEAALADDICARSDYSKVVKKWRQSPELARLAQAADGAVMLEETERLADGKVAQAFDLARSAINAQNAVLDKAVPGVLGEAKDRKASWFSRTPDFDKVVEMLTAATVQGWGETRETVLWGEEAKPANAGEQHRELFPSVKKRIELVAKTILEKMEEKSETPPEEKPPEDPPEETPPEETPPEETPPEETPPEELEFTISVKKSGGMLETKILKGKAPVFERTCPAKAGEFRSLTGSLVDKLIEVLEIK